MAHEQLRKLQEKEAYWNTIQTVQPGETFLLFHPHRNGTTIRQTDNLTFGGMASRIRLQTGIFDLLNLSITSAPYVLPRLAVFTPFDRARGYPLDQEDFTWRTRQKKIQRLQHELAAHIEGLGLVIFVTYEDMAFSRAMQAILGENEALVPSEIAALLGRIHLTLTFPDGSSFTARALCNTNRLFLLFRTFFPTDTGPLPVGDLSQIECNNWAVEEGFRILLPFQEEQVQSIQGKFVLL